MLLSVFFCGIPFLAFRRKKVAIIVSLCGGGIVGVVRILQGGHYLTDVLAAGVVVWVTAFIVIYITDKILQFYL
jgi:membrane-associated phospholipid phosphatase